MAPFLQWAMQVLLGLKPTKNTSTAPRQHTTDYLNGSLRTFTNYYPEVDGVSWGSNRLDLYVTLASGLVAHKRWNGTD